jgi:hypothetical protein
VDASKSSSVEKAARPKAGRSSWIPKLKVRRQLYPGCWAMEDEFGQLYITVRGARFDPLERYVWPTEEELHESREAS